VRLAVVGGWLTGAMRSSHIVYVDESGSPAIGSNLASYPVFVLAFCIFEVGTYVNKIEPAFQAIKFKHFGHDLLIFHESEIRKRSGSFGALHESEFREGFLDDLGLAIAESKFWILPIISQKSPLTSKKATSDDIYAESSKLGIERVVSWVAKNGHLGNELVFAFESRGASEDRSLLKTLNSQLPNDLGVNVLVKFIPKTFASTGLQIADLVARPIGLSVIRPGQANRSFELIRDKIIA
jgi:hypothetical protein